MNFKMKLNLPYEILHIAITKQINIFMCIFSFSMYMIVGRNKHFKSDHQFYLTHELFTLKNEKINDAQSDK